MWVSEISISLVIAISCCIVTSCRDRRCTSFIFIYSWQGHSVVLQMPCTHVHLLWMWMKHEWKDREYSRFNTSSRTHALMVIYKRAYQTWETHFSKRFWVNAVGLPRKGQERLTKVAKFGPFACTILYESCLFYPSWQATSFERPLS